MSFPATSAPQSLQLAAVDTIPLDRVVEMIEGAIVWMFRATIGLYKRLLSPLLPAACRFHPSCSSYADEALHRHGLLRGSAYATWRILRCNPLCEGGMDPVPVSDRGAQ
jgi:putative membrane protein insertion efficiency factor